MTSVWLTYHDIYSEKPHPAAPPSAAIYHVSEQNFRQQLQAIHQSGRRVITASRFAQTGDQDTVVITFDDGWAGSFEIGLPLLQQAGFKATYFITKNFVGRDGFCTEAQIVQAADAGMEIGIHGTTHRMLSSCSAADVEWELNTCGRFLESLVGHRVETAAVPGGAVNSTVTACARALGLKLLCTSQIGINKSNTETSLLHLKRVTIRQSTSALDVQRYCRYDLNRELLRWAILQIPRSLLGMKNYARLRRRLLDEPESAHLYEP